MLLNNPSVINRATLIGASADAFALLETLPCVSVELAEVFRCVDAVTTADQIAYVTPVKCPDYPYGAVVTDAEGNLLAAAKGKSKEGLAELIRLKLLPPTEGFGESAACATPSNNFGASSPRRAQACQRCVNSTSPTSAPTATC